MIWLIGNKGMLGTELSTMLSARHLPFIGTDRDVDITNFESLTAFTDNLSQKGSPVSLIINCAAYTAVDKAEDDRKLCKFLNEDGAANIAKAAFRCTARMIHISTDYVFNGKGSAPYNEGDATDPIGYYGLTKKDGELRVLEENPASWIVRTAWLYGEHGNNFVYTMLKLMKDRTELKVVNDQKGTPTWARDLCDALLSLYNAQADFGIYHFSNAGEITWFDFATEIQKQGRALGLLERDCAVIPCTSAEFPAKVTRPSYSVLNKAKISSVKGVKIPDWKDSLAAFLCEEKK